MLPAQTLHKVEMLARERHSSLFGPFMSYKEKIIVNKATVMAVTFPYY